jgi:intein/homing endonuclease
MGGVLRYKVKVEWSSNLAYAIGLIASDGYLDKDQRHISFSSKDMELMLKFKEALSLNNRISPRYRNGREEASYFYLSFGDVTFYKFLNKIGLTSAKSKTIKSVQIPKKFFVDFFRGLFDGDGTFYTYYDRRWPNSFCFKTSIASASREFIDWLKKKLTDSHDVAGLVHKGAGVFNLEYTKGDSRKLFSIMYYAPELLFFSEKYNKMKTAFEQDSVHGILSLQKRRTPR